MRVHMAPRVSRSGAHDHSPIFAALDHRRSERGRILKPDRQIVTRARVSSSEPMKRYWRTSTLPCRLQTAIGTVPSAGSWFGSHIIRTPSCPSAPEKASNPNRGGIQAHHDQRAAATTVRPRLGWRCDWSGSRFRDARCCRIIHPRQGSLRPVPRSGRRASATGA